MAGKKRSSQQVRIIGGKWKGRKLQFSGGEQLRPTLGRTRETLFNWLRPHIQGARCLDLFAGSGILGFEALSQGAASVVFVERDPRSWQSLRTAMSQFGAADCAELVGGDALRYLRRVQLPFDIVFLDPPFHEASLLVDAMRVLRERMLVTRFVYAEARHVHELDQAAAIGALEITKRTRTGSTAAALMCIEEFAGGPAQR